MPFPCIPSPMSHLTTFLVCYALGVLTGWSMRSSSHTVVTAPIA